MAKKKKGNALEMACDKKLEEIARELEETNCSSERIKVLTDNAGYLKETKKTDPKGFKAWIKKIEAKDVLSFSFSVGMFFILLYGESLGHIITSKAQNFVPWTRTPKL